MSYKAEASYQEWQDLVDELSSCYDEITEENAREVLIGSEFGDPNSDGQIKALIEDAKQKGGEH